MTVQPKLRFKGFTDAWEKRQLGEVFNQTVEYINPNEAHLELWSVTVEKGLTPKTDRYNREALVKKNDKFKVVHDGDIVYNPMNLTIGSVGFNEFEKNVAVSGYYVTMNTNQGFSNKYFKTWLKSTTAIKKFKLYATGSLIEKQRVQFPTLSLIKTYVPTFDEQKRMGKLFVMLDNLIVVNQRKVDLLKELKKGFLQKMFPKNGEDKPEIRFGGYTDAWEKRKLYDLLKERNKQIEPNNEYELMSFVAGTGVTPKGERYDRSALVTNNSKKYKVTEFGDFIYSSNNLETGSIGFNKTGKAVISPVYSIFYSTENADSRFIGLLSSQKKFIQSMVRYRQGVVYGQWRIHESDFLQIKVSTPSMDEQNKFIEFFEQFDNLITVNQRRVDLLKQEKKALLQKMFV